MSSCVFWKKWMKQKTIVYANNRNINKLSAKKNVLFLGLVFLTRQIAEEKITPKKRRLTCSKKKVFQNNIILLNMSFMPLVIL